jgi:hypothetical protein
MLTTGIRTTTSLAAAVVFCALSPSHAAAKSCADASVSARGEPASLQWLARLKARGNWRVKVRAMPDLGSAYANWTNADNQVVRCISNTGSIVCTVTATPCRP